MGQMLLFQPLVATDTCPKVTKNARDKNRMKTYSKGLTKGESSESADREIEKFTNRLAFSFSACPYPLLLSPVWQVAS